MNLRWKLFIVTLLIAIPLAARIGYLFKEDIMAAQDNGSDSKISKLSLALIEYYDKNGSFPPARFQRNPNEPFHSWRVLLLHDAKFDGYENYDFSKKWNDEKNLNAFGKHCPRIYTFSNAAINEQEHTDYLALGPEDEWPIRGLLKTHVVNMEKDRFIIFEMRDSKIHWLEPRY